MIALGFGLFLFTVGGSGYLLVYAADTPSFSERLGTGFVVGATALPLVLFTADALFGQKPLAAGGFGFYLTVLIAVGMGVVMIAPRFAPHLARPMRALSAAAKEPTRKRPRLFDRLLIAALWTAIAVFGWEIYAGLRAPLFGWDEYSYWLYAAKILYLTGGKSQALLANAFASYPLGFPYLIGWLYHLTGVVSIANAKWVSPLTTVAMLLAMRQLLRRIGLSPFASLLAVALTAWGSREMLWYNWLAFGEMAFVNTYVLANLYAVAWLRTRATSDLALAGLLFGLTVFLRVDGLYIIVFTLTLLYLFARIGADRHKNPGKGRAKTAALFLSLAFGPGILWFWYRAHFNARAGWLTRISGKTIAHRLQPAFLAQMWGSMWHMLSDMHLYPIMAALAVLIAFAPFVRKREPLFLTAVAVAQIAYLFAAYLTVFSSFEALHASSFDRYLLRDDPLIAVAFVLLVADWPQTGGRRSTRKKDSSRRRRVRPLPATSPEPPPAK